MTGSMFAATVALLMLPPASDVAPMHAGLVKSEAALSAQAPRSQTIRESLANLDYGAAGISPEKPASGLQGPSSKPQRSMSSKVIGGVVGAAAGFLVGHYLGQAFGGYGAHRLGGSAGAIIGAVLGAKF